MTPEELRQKRLKGEIACAECRRLKLKCDKKVPCGTCVRRGYSSICPHLSHSSGHAPRLVSTETNQLHAKIIQMSERIRLLEEALDRAQAQLEPGTAHLLLQKEFMSIKHVSPGPDPEDDDEGTDVNAADGHGSLAIAPDGAVHYFGRMAGTETLFMTAAANIPPGESQTSLHTMHGFPDGLPFHPNPPLQEGLAFLVNSLPPRESAVQLIKDHFDNAGTHFRPLNQSDMHEFVLDAIYNTLPGNGLDCDLHPHLLGLIYAIFAVSALLDISLPQKNAKAEEYHHLSKSAMAMKSVLEDTTLWTVVALGYTALYLHTSEKSRTHLQGSRYWGITCLLAQSLGLHRDPAKWGLSPRMVELRRRVFWAIYSLDHFQTMTSGNPAFFPAKRVDCEFPVDEEETYGPDGRIQPGYFTWGFLTVRAFLAELNAATTNASPPSYQMVLSLDSKIREFHKPWQRLDSLESSPSRSPWALRMQRFVPALVQYISLVYLHRTYFAQCCREYPTRPTKSPYATSYIATYDSAIRVLALVRKEAQGHMKTIVRIPYIWTHVFTSAIIVGSAIERGPNNAFASSGLIELAQGVGLFEEAAKSLRRARVGLPYLTRLLQKAHHAYTEYNTKGVVQPSPPSVNGPGEDEVDLGVLGGQTRLFFPSTSGQGSSNYRASSPGPAAVMEAIQSVSALQNPPPHRYGEAFQPSDIAALPGTFAQPAGSIRTGAGPSQYEGYYGASAFTPSIAPRQGGDVNVTTLDTGTIALADLYDPLYSDQTLLSPENVDPGETWGMSNMMGSVEVEGGEGGPYQVLPHQQLPIDAVNLFGLDPTGGTTQADESWTTFLRDTGLFYMSNDESSQVPDVGTAGT